MRNDQVIQSTLFTAYLCGFGRFFDERDARLGGIIRFALLRMFYPEAECQQRYDRVGELIADDQSVRAAFTLAGEYGASYFEALLQQRDADERATQNLILLIRTSKGSLLVELYVESHRCNLVDGITISSSDRDYLNNDAIVENAIDEPVTHRPELDLIAVRHSAQTRCGNTGIG